MPMHGVGLAAKVPIPMVLAASIAWERVVFEKQT
jgi:hypothetical protein